MKFQELMRGAISSEQPVWIISGQSNLPDSTLAIVNEVRENYILTSGSRLELESDNLFLMFGTTLFSLENCRASKAANGQMKLSFASVVQIFPKVAAGFVPNTPVPSLKELVRQAATAAPGVPFVTQLDRNTNDVPEENRYYQE